MIKTCSQIEQDGNCGILGKFCQDITDEDCPKIPGKGKIRMFDSGATRDTDENKLDYEGFLSPIVIKRYGQYLHKHRKQSDGQLRDSDNWQKGMPLSTYMKSMWRHFVDVWTSHREETESLITRNELEDALCAVMFNAMGYLHELLKGKEE